MGPYLALAPPAGLYRNGTINQAKGRWYDANLFRFEQDQVKPVRGWQLRSNTAAAMSGACRAVLSWRDNNTPAPNRWIACGTHSHLYLQDEAGTVHDITPVGYSVGRPDATRNQGYGGSTYGTAFYGVPRPSTGAYLPATVWSLDPWGEDLVGCADKDGKIYLWTPPSSGTVAAVVAGAPTGNAGIVVTQEGFLFALGAGGDGRRVAWCDQQNITVWTPLATNQAGDFDLSTVGTLLCAKALPAGALCFTDVDVWRASYIGAPLVYSFERVGSGCGPISRGAVSTHDSMAVWMGAAPSFWRFNGQAVEPLDCDVLDKLVDINVNQASKVTAVQLATAGEIWWFYPSAASNECDSYVAWSYRESARLGREVWTFGSISRLGGSGKGVMPNPIMVDAGGLIYEHETGLNYDGAVPFIESGPIEIGRGEYMAEIQRVIPDEGQDGAFQMQLFGRLWPDDAEFASDPVALTSPTELFFQAREIRVRFTSTGLADCRLGPMRFEIIQGDPL